MNVYLFQLVNGVGIGMIYFLIAVGLSIIFGLLHFVNFAHGAFYLLGSYLAYQALAWTGNFWLCLVAAPLVVAVLAWFTEKLLVNRVYNLHFTFHILSTFGLALVIREVAIVVWGPIGLNVPPPDLLRGVVLLGDFAYPIYRLFVIGFGAVMAVGLWYLLDRTRFGAVIRAGSESTEMVSLLGIDIYRAFAATFALGAGFAALAGVLIAPIRGADPFMGTEALGIAFVVVVLGGMGTFIGALVGGLLVGIAQSMMSSIWPEGAQLIIYTIMAAVIIARPYGLFGRA